MTFIPVNFDEVQEPKPAAVGRYDLQIVACTEAVTGPNSKVPGSPQLKVQIGFVDHPNTPNIQQYISLPSEHDDTDKALFKALLLKRFLTMFKVSFASNGIDTEKVAMEMVGSVANAEVGLTEPNDNGDVYNQLKVPKMANEPSGQGRGKPPTRKS